MNEEELFELGRRLKAIREELGLKQKEFAAGLGITPSYLSEIEKDKKKPGYRFLKCLYEKYNVSLNWLIAEDGEMFCGGGDGDKEGIGHLDFGDQTERLYEMLGYMARSPFFLSYMMAQFMQAYYEFESTIQKDMDKNKPPGSAHLI